MNTKIEDVLDEIIILFKNNLLLMLNNDKYLINLKNKIKSETISFPLCYNELLFYANEALKDLINNEFLYDFRDID